MEPQPENLIQTAWQISNLINDLNEFLWEHYGDSFIEICLQEEEEEFLRTLDLPIEKEEDPSD